MNILFLADPNSIHDIKWMKWFSEKNEYSVYLLARKLHLPAKKLNNIEFLGSVEDYSVFKPWKNKEGKNKIEDIIFNKKIDLVHIYYAEPNLLWANQINIPVVLTTRGSDVLVGLKQFVYTNGFKNKIILKQYQKAINKCKSVISTSQKQIEFLTKNFNLNCDSLIVRTGVDIENIEPLQDNRKIILFPRNMQPIYNHEFALRVIKQLPKYILDDYKFVFVNKDSSNINYVSKIEKIISDLNNVDILFLDALKGVEYYQMIAKSKLVVMTPNSDGAPVSAMETIATGVKLILPDLDYDVDLFRSAYFYSRNNEMSLLNTIIEVLEKDREEVINEGYKTKVDRANEMKKVEMIYNNVLK